MPASAQLESAAQQNQNLLGLLKEVETLKAEVAKLRGLTEVQAHQLDTLDKRQTDLYADLDQRLTELAKTAQGCAAPWQRTPPAAAVATPPVDTQAESAAYEAALKLFRDGNLHGRHRGVQGVSQNLSRQRAGTQRAILGGLFVLRIEGLQDRPWRTSRNWWPPTPPAPRCPTRMLNIATNQIALNKLAGARKTLEELVAKYPGTPAADAGEPTAVRAQVSVVAEASTLHPQGQAWSRP